MKILLLMIYVLLIRLMVLGESRRLGRYGRQFTRLKFFVPQGHPILAEAHLEVELQLPYHPYLICQISSPLKNVFHLAEKDSQGHNLNSLPFQMAFGRW